MMGEADEAGEGRGRGRKRYRRVRRVLNHANPLFDQWLREWQEEAERKDSMMKWNFQRARKSLSLFPLPLYRGEDCKVLANFGDKLCQMLDLRLREYEQEHGPVDWTRIHKVRDEVPKKGVKRRKKNGMTACTTQQRTPQQPTTPATPGSRKNSGSRGSSKEKQSREYVPTVRSGASAILMALYNAAQTDGYKGYLKKTELIKCAQPLCDASMTHPAEGSHYTAWTSVSTLVKKHLVVRESNPAKYSLTQQGEALAARIASAESNMNPGDPLASPLLSTATATSPIMNSTFSATSLTNTRTDPPDRFRNTNRNRQPDPIAHTLSDSSDDELCVIEESVTGRTEIIAEKLENTEERFRVSPVRCEEMNDDDEGLNGDADDELPVLTSPTASSRHTSASCNLRRCEEMNDDAEIEPIAPASPISSGLQESMSCIFRSPAQRDPGEVRFSYVTTLGQETPLKDRAAVTVEDDGFLGFLIKIRTGDLPLLAQASDTRPNHTGDAPPGFVYVYLSNDGAPEISPGLRASLPKSPITPCQEKAKRKSPSSSSTSSLQVSRKSSTVPASPQSPLVPCQEKARPKVSRKAKTDTDMATSTGKGRSGTTQRKARTKQVNEKKDDNEAPIVSASTQLPSTTSFTSPSTPLFTFMPGSYEIVLCVDNMETSGKQTGEGKVTGRQITKDIIISELRRHGVKFDVRKLHVGDFLWVCRDLATCGGREVREVVLPYIVERKRMDDLASSIKDGRFREQKFRLRDRGWPASRPIYLVEEYSSKNLSLPESTCQQAMVNTQISDRFTVKVTQDQRESAAYLTIMTRCIQSSYQGKSVSGLRLQDLKETPQDSECNWTPQTRLPTFPEFNASCAKTQQLTVREMFAKQLLQMHGLSVDKARAMVDQYGTPKLLVSALERLSDEGEEGQEKLLAGLKCGKSGRSFGAALSASIARLYTRENLQ